MAESAKDVSGPTDKTKPAKSNSMKPEKTVF
jgi:hypothetical protein